MKYSLVGTLSHILLQNSSKLRTLPPVTMTINPTSLPVCDAPSEFAAQSVILHHLQKAAHYIAARSKRPCHWLNLTVEEQTQWLLDLNQEMAVLTEAVSELSALLLPFSPVQESSTLANLCCNCPRVTTDAVLAATGRASHLYRSISLQAQQLGHLSCQSLLAEAMALCKASLEREEKALALHNSLLNAFDTPTQLK
jgi:hypothetical protein